MVGAPIEATLELWVRALRDAKARMRPVFVQDRVAASAGQFLDGLLGSERRKTGWMRAEAAGEPGPWRQQDILGRGRWESDALRDIVRDYALETLADPDAVLVIDETGFLKQGKASCGVGRQYTGSAGKIINCQMGSLRPMRHGTCAPSSTAPSTCRRPGPTTQPAGQRRNHRAFSFGRAIGRTSPSCQDVRKPDKKCSSVGAAGGLASVIRRSAMSTKRCCATQIACSS